MSNDIDYIRAGIAMILLVGIITIKIIMLAKPISTIDIKVLTQTSDNYSQELDIDEQAK